MQQQASNHIHTYNNVLYIIVANRISKLPNSPVPVDESEEAKLFLRDQRNILFSVPIIY